MIDTLVKKITDRYSLSRYNPEQLGELFEKVTKALEKNPGFKNKRLDVRVYSGDDTPLFR